MVIDWFYDKKINVYSYSDDNYDEFGVSCDGYSLKYENIFVDIQPSSAEKIEKSYGYKVECTKVIYSNEKIEESDIILYNDTTYKVTKSIEWDDYYVTAIIEEDVNLNV